MRINLPSALLAACLLAACSQVMQPRAGQVIQGQGLVASRNLPAEAVLFAVGDIADSSLDAAVTAKLLDGQPGTVAVLGDNAYPDGSPANYANYYEPTWGRHKARTKPAVGNHEYHTAKAAGYFGYFGALAGEPDKGYYAYDLSATWRAIVLNSNWDAGIGVGQGSPQYNWLYAELEANRGRHVVAYWHHPRFSSGPHGDNEQMNPIWALLYAHGADLVLSGHDHHYERMHPLNAAGVRDDARGIRSFVVGTGGRKRYPLNPFGRKITAVRDNHTYGVLKLTLRPNAYRWEFIPEPGKKFRDEGESATHALED